MCRAFYIKTIFVLFFVQWFFSLHSQQLVPINRYGYNDVKDVVLVYCGNNKRLDWTVSDFTPYVTHTFLDGRKSWLFQGFVFLELEMNSKQSFLHRSSPTAIFATKKDWMDYINQAYDSGRAFDALNKTIEEQKQVLGDPPFRHKVIYGIPAPIKNQKDWGKIGNRSLDFEKREDRASAVKWYVDAFMDTYKKHHYKNWDFEGFYWIEEDLEKTGTKLLHEIADYIHQKYHLKFYWMPYLKAYGSTNWQENGFDYAYTQSGYSIAESVDYSWLTKMCDKAKTRGMGIVIEFSGSLFAKPDIFVKRLNETIDELEKRGIYEAQTALAYYEGGRLVKDIHNGKHWSYKTTKEQLLSIKKVMDRLAQHIVDRHSTSSLPNNVSPSNSNKYNNDWRNPEYWHF